MRLDLLPVLKEKLLTAKEFIDVATYFMDHFGEDPEFMDQGKAVGDPVLAGVIQGTVAEMLGGSPVVSRLVMIRLKKYHFMHGGFMVGPDPGNFIFFDDVQMGMVTVCDMATGMTKMARISPRILPPAGHD